MQRTLQPLRLASRLDRILTGRFLAIGGVIGLFAVGFISFLSAPPNLKTQVALARAALLETRQAHALRYEQDAITALPFEADQVEDQKILFLARMLPLVVAENTRIRKQRETLLHNPSKAHLNALALAYGLPPGNVDQHALLRRIDVVPISLVLAQAAIESAWGTSRFARQGRAFFGEHTTDPDVPGIKPKRANGFRVKSFESAQMSVRSYLKTLNTHNAYKALRMRRAALRALGERLSGADLAHHLMAYSQLGSEYITMIRDTIRVNQLRDFDGLRLPQ